VTALLSSVLAIVLGIAPAPAVLAAYADPVIFVFIGSFILAEAMKDSGLDRRLAHAVLRRSWATASTAGLMLTLGIVTCALSLWMSSTATTALMLPVGLGVLRALGQPVEGDATRFATGLLLMLTWSSSVAVGIPVGSPPNLIAIGMIRELAGHRLSFFDWAAVTMPPGSWTPAQRNVLAVFLLAALLWLVPGAAATVTGADHPVTRFFDAHVPESAVALGAAIMLFMLPTDWRRGEFTIPWRRAATIDWGTILLFGGGLALGKLMFTTGLAASLAAGAVALTGSPGLWTLTAVAIVCGIVLSETSSNTAAASMVLPVVIALAQRRGSRPSRRLSARRSVLASASCCRSPHRPTPSCTARGWSPCARWSARESGSTSRGPSSSGSGCASSAPCSA
jgi:sodium-dependent dicarboxylate transporter 2/3/5